MKSINVNFIFIRHGFACHNAVRPLYKYKLSPATSIVDLGIDGDPELTPLGVDATIHNGCILEKVLNNLWKFDDDERIRIDNIDIIGSSPLIRSMETAFYITKKWNNQNGIPNKYYVFPYLREIDETSHDKYSSKSINRINTIPEYKMSSTIEQQAYLSKEGNLDFFDFSPVIKYAKERESPGDIKTFIKWFMRKFLPNKKPKSKYNVLIVTHAGVLFDYAHESFNNNSGFVLNTTVDSSFQNITYNKFRRLKPFLPKTFFTNYNSPEFGTMDYYCPSSRCGNLCSNTSSTSLKNLNSNCK